MASIPTSHWRTTWHGGNLSLSNWGSMDFCCLQWNHTHFYVLLLCLLHHEMGIPFTKAIDYLPTNHTIHYRTRLLCVLLFHRRLLEGPWKAFCFLLYLRLCLDEPSHVPQLLPNNIFKGWKRKIFISKDRLKYYINCSSLVQYNLNVLKYSMIISNKHSKN